MSYYSPIVEEVRLIREAHAAKFNYDVEAIWHDLAARTPEDAVSLPPRPPEFIPITTSLDAS